MKRRFGTIIQIGDCLISEDVITEYFACDYGKCKGCCCVIGDSGAPLEEAEIPKIEENYPHYQDIMQEAGRREVAAKGFFEVDRDGDLVTPLCPGSEECVYMQKDSDGGCFCAIERAWFGGRGNFRKPISCWLYPIRISRFPNGTEALNLHRWDICRDAYEKGKKEGIRVYQFLREPLIERYGAEFYDALCIAAEKVLESQ